MLNADSRRSEKEPFLSLNPLLWCCTGCDGADKAVSESYRGDVRLTPPPSDSPPQYRIKSSQNFRCCKVGKSLGRVLGSQEWKKTADEDDVGLRSSESGLPEPLDSIGRAHEQSDDG